MAAVMLTTVDNPYNPLTQFRSWYMYDVLNGYNTCNRLDKEAITSDLMSEAEEKAEIERAIDFIIKNDPENIYRKVVEGQPMPTS